MTEDNPLRRFAPSPFSRIAMQFGKGDAASAAGRPLRGGRWPRLGAFIGRPSESGPNHIA